MLETTAQVKDATSKAARAAKEGYKKTMEELKSSEENIEEEVVGE